jgi:DNA mismatch repair protein MutS2
LPLLHQYQEFLSDINLIAAKAKYARKPYQWHFAQDYRRAAFILQPSTYFVFEQQTEKRGHASADFRLSQDNRIIAISGEHAGGKTISLKSVGLLQLMLQSGMLIRVHERSETFLFDRILTDIGDNQSIENHLSTYSYRLKNMNISSRNATRKPCS